MVTRLIAGGTLLCALLGASFAEAATLTTHASEADFTAALDPSAVILQESFDGFADGTPISTQIPGIVFSSPHAGQAGYVDVKAFTTNRSESAPNILSGGYIDGSLIAQTIAMDFPTPVSGLFFTLIAQNPNRLVREMTIEFADGSPPQTTPIVDTDGTNNNREFFALTSDVAMTKATLTMAPKSGGQFNEFGGLDGLGYAFVDDAPPLCDDVPGFRGAVPGAEGMATDLGVGQSGIVDVSLDAGADNVALTVDPFTAPATTVTYFLSQTDADTDGTGTARVTDASGNSCITEVTFRVLPSGTVVNQALCSGEGITLTASNENPAIPAGLSICSGSTEEFEPAFPPGYEKLPGCRVITVNSEISGLTESLYDLDGPFQPAARVLFSRSDDGVNFSDFTDVTVSVFHFNPTRMRTATILWSDVKYTCAIQAEICDGLDNDSDGLIDEGFELELVECVGPGPFDPAVCDVDGDGFFVCGDPEVAEAAELVEPTNGDCADQLSFINVASPELCNGLDDDCDGTIDNGNPEGGQSCPISGQLGICAEGTTACEESRIVCNQTVSPGDRDEVCDGLDNDCDGTVDEPDAVDASTWYADADSDGYGDPNNSQIACDAPSGFVSDNTDCDDTDAANNPAGQEVCDGEDNDCDGTVDEPDAADAATWYADADSDGYGNPAVSQPACDAPSGFVSDNTDCDDSSALSNPAAPEICDGADNDCDGTVDDGNPGGDLACSVPGQSGVCAASLTVCSNGAIACPQTVSPTTEVCDGADNNCNGETDEIIVFGGFQPPVDPAGSTVFLHRTDPRSRGTKAIPFRFELFDCDNAPITDDAPTIAIVSQTPGVAGTELAAEDISCGKRDEGGVVEFNDSTQRYEYNFCTKALEPDTTLIFGVTTGDGAVNLVQVSLD